MSTGLIIFLVAFLFVLVLAYNVVLQYKIQEEQKRKLELARYRNILNSTEELIGFSAHLPFSNNLYICLYTRISDALTSMISVDPKNKDISLRINGVKDQIRHLRENPKDTNDLRFQTPKNDKQAIVLLKIVKRLRDAVRTEHKKGRFPTQAYVVENSRLEIIQLKINVENAIKRSNDALSAGQHGTALQLIKKSMALLQTRNDEYSVNGLQKLQVILDKLQNKRQKNNKEEIEKMREKERDEMDEIFGEKKKW